MEMLQQCDRILPGGAAKFIEDCKFYRGQARPSIAPQDLARMLRVEVALLTGADRTWSADLLLTDSRPLIEVDPARLGETLAVNPAKAYYHNGHWTEAPGTGSSGMRR